MSYHTIIGNYVEKSREEENKKPPRIWPWVVVVIASSCVALMALGLVPTPGVVKSSPVVAGPVKSSPVVPGSSASDPFYTFINGEYVKMRCPESGIVTVFTDGHDGSSNRRQFSAEECLGLKRDLERWRAKKIADGEDPDDIIWKQVKEHQSRSAK